MRWRVEWAASQDQIILYCEGQTCAFLNFNNFTKEQISLKNAYLVPFLAKHLLVLQSLQGHVIRACIFLPYRPYGEILLKMHTITVTRKADSTTQYLGVEQ